MNNFKVKIVLILFGFLNLVCFKNALAHEEGAPFSGAIIEPVRVHHAHIEDEQKLNSAFSKGYRKDDGTEGFAFENSLELAAAWDKQFRVGSEILIPFLNRGLGTDQYGIGDITLWPLKYAIINSPETILTGVLSLTIPSGSETKGLGEGETFIGPNFFIDHAYRNWFFGFNSEFGFGLSNKRSVEMELAAVMAYSFIRETGDGMAPSVPSQSVVPAIGFEVVTESILNGEEEGENTVSVLPVFSLWLPKSGWSFQLAAETPISATKPEDFTVHFQVGNHFDWKRLFVKK